MAILPNIIVLLSNTINSVYFYQVLLATPESLAQLSMAFSVGSMLGAIAAFGLRNEATVIYISVIICAVMSLILALLPTLSVFLLALAVFGFTNSASRVMFRLAIMKNIPDNEAGNFYALRSSLVSGAQLIALLAMHGAIQWFSPAVSVWFFPAVFLALPILWGLSKWFIMESHRRQAQLEER